MLERQVRAASAVPSCASAPSQGEGPGLDGAVLTADQHPAVGAQQLDGAAIAQVQRLVKAADVVDVHRGPGDAAEVAARPGGG